VTVNITVNLESPVPVYKQIVHSIISGIEENELSSSVALPSIRQLASDLALTTATVSKSYQILQKNKIIVTGGRRGTFVSSDAPVQVKRFLQNELQWDIEEFVSKQLQTTTTDQLKTTFNQIIEKIERGESL
jgi:GntR family transcriptional regulator